MNPLRTSLALVAALVAITTGCTKIPKNTSLMAATQAPDHVALDVFFVRVPLSDQAVIRDLWSEVDEQAIPLEVRRRLVANGFVVGQLGAQLPAALVELLKIRDDAPTLDPTQPPAVDLTRPTLVHRQRLDIYRPDTPSRIVVTGQDQRHEKLQVLFCDEDGDRPFVWGDTFYNVQGVLSTTVQPEPDGRVKLTLAPEIEHDQARQKFTAQSGAGWEMEFAPPHRTFDSLRFSSTLSPGEILVVTCQGDRPGSLGQQFFTERRSDVLNQTVLLIRLAQGKADDLFSGQTPSE